MARAIRPTSYGGPEVLDLVEVPIPVPAPGEVMVRVKDFVYTGRQLGRSAISEDSHAFPESETSPTRSRHADGLS